MGICTNIGSPNKFAQFIGRGVRRLGAHNLEANLAPHVDDGGTTARDNSCHVVSHEFFSQFGHWGPFISQEGSGDFDPNAPDVPDGDVDDDASVASEDMTINERMERFNQEKRQRTADASGSGARVVQRYAMARTPPLQQAMLDQDRLQHDHKMNQCGWTIENKTYVAHPVAPPIA